MKRVLLCFLLPFLLFGENWNGFVPDGGDLLLTYQRSGTNWTIGILQALCKRPVRYLGNPRLKSVGVNRLGFHVDNSLPILYRTHHLLPAIWRLDQSQFRLLFTLRNYKECIVKQYQLSAERFLEAMRTDAPEVKSYFSKLSFFESEWWDPSTKHLIIYEDIISNPRRCVEELLLFLEEDLGGVPEFFETYDEWNEQMLESYHKQHASKGAPSNNQPIFHSKDFPKELLREVDAIIEARYPDLWEKYLSRYQERE